MAEDIYAAGRLTERTRVEAHDDGPPGLAALTCKLCGTPTINICKGCWKLGYCTSGHQKQVSVVVCLLPFNRDRGVSDPYVNLR